MYVQKPIYAYGTSYLEFLNTLFLLNYPKITSEGIFIASLAKCQVFVLVIPNTGSRIVLICAPFSMS